MESYYGLFSVFSIVYTLILTVLFLGKGFYNIIWALILVWCITLFDYNAETEMFVINEEGGISMWIFHPMNFVGGLILALGLSISIKMGSSQAKREGGWY